MTGPISGNRLLGSLKEAASWPGADQSTVVTLATTLVAVGNDAEGSSFFQDLSERNPANATAQALAGFFQVRAHDDVAAFVTAAATLAGQGDLVLALEVLAPGLLRHPDSRELAELRQAVLVRLMEQRQFWDPFGFQVYTELANAELSPVG